jgi:adenylate kinase
MLGAPASGKGTQAARLASHFDLPNLSTGALMRTEQQRGSNIGRLADQHLAGGGFFPDDLMVEIMIAWLGDTGGDGFVLDGFPRTLPQGQAFDTILAEQGKPLDAAILLDADLETLHQRIANRVQCDQCAGSFQRQEGGAECPRSGCDGQLAPRPDDQPAPYAGRLANYRQLTEPLIQHYLSSGCLKRVDGRAPSDDVFAEILELLGDRSISKTT